MRLFVAVSLFVVLSSSHGAKILGILPTPSISHQLPFRLVMQGLHAQGHEITIITTDPVKKNATNYNEIDVSFVYEYWRATFNFTSMAGSSPYDTLNLYPLMGELVSEHELSSPQVQALINSGQKFDLVILEALFYQSFYGLWHRVGSPPLIYFLTLGMWGPVYDFIGNPHNPSYSPAYHLPYTDRMTFWQRLNSAYYSFKSRQIYANEIRPSQERLMRKFFGDEPPPIIDSEKNVSLVLTNNHWLMNFPRPYLPSVVELTGLHILEKRTPLPEDMKKFLDGAKNGAIYFSLGTNVNGSTMPLDKKKAFLDAFAELPQRVLWKWESGFIEGKPDNVFMSKWFPQQDILAHPNTKLFITQGGLQSLNEAGYFGVPMVVIPFFGDQVHNSAKVVQTSLGIRLSFQDVTKESVLNAVGTILQERKFKGTNAILRNSWDGLQTNEIVMSYREAMDTFSAMYKEEPSKSVKRAVWWVEYVLRHKGAKHLRSASLDLHWTQLLLLDVLLVVALAFFAVLTVVIVVVRQFLRFLLPKQKVKKQ